MAHYLRDQRIENISIDEESISQISAAFEERLNTLIGEQREGENAFLTYIIRFDNKGYRVFALEELLRYFNQAKTVERIVFSLETTESLRSSRNTGAYMELQLDENDPSRCIFQVTSDKKNWVDSSFSAVSDILAKCKNKNGWARTTWTPLGVQITGVAIGFILCLWAAFKIAPLLKIESPFVISFLFLLLIFSNIWTYANPALLRLIANLFPNMKFARPSKQRIHWLLQTVVGSATFAIAVWLLALASTFLIDVLKEFISVSI